VFEKYIYQYPNIKNVYQYIDSLYTDTVNYQIIPIGSRFETETIKRFATHVQFLNKIVETFEAFNVKINIYEASFSTLFTCTDITTCIGVNENYFYEKGLQNALILPNSDFSATAKLDWQRVTTFYGWNHTYKGICRELLHFYWKLWLEYVTTQTQYPYVGDTFKALKFSSDLLNNYFTYLFNVDPARKASIQAFVALDEISNTTTLYFGKAMLAV
ncbi:hypothetical protein MXB_5327, partial [Myxobolus squamalis]